MQNDLPKRKSIRLPNYDYAQAGNYFITICTQDGRHYFGEIVGATLCGRPNNPHVMIQSRLLELNNRFDDVVIPEYVVMPNHVHFIVRKTHKETPLSAIIGWYKTMTTNDYIKGVKNGLYEPFDKKLWQRNYYEHIIRNEEDYFKIAESIQNNPKKWEMDCMNSLRHE